MSALKKLRKLIRNPNLYFYDYFAKKLNIPTGRNKTELQNKVENKDKIIVESLNICEYNKISLIPNKEKILINHFYVNGLFSNGVTNYIRSICDMDEEYGSISKPYPMNEECFRHYIINNIPINKFKIIEVAESQASALYLNNNANVHVRMHCPFYLYKKIIQEDTDEIRFSTEVRAMYKAKAVSSPSHGMLEYLADELNIDNIHVYKNPCVNRLNDYNNQEKIYDVCFYGRFNALKGNQFLEKIIQELPNNYKVLVLGKQEQKIKIDKIYNDRVKFIDHLEGDDKFKSLSQSKVMISLSKFENCSMAILDALSIGVPVVCWDVGGNAEIASPEILKAISPYDIKQFSNEIINFVNNPIDRQSFEKEINLINMDFKKGLKFVEDVVLGKQKGIYKGLDHRLEHYSETYIPYQIYSDLPKIQKHPLNFLIVTKNKDLIDVFNDIGKKFNKNISYIAENKRNLEYVEFKKNCLYNCPRPDVIFIDRKFAIDLNFIRKLKKETRSILIYVDYSPIHDNSFILDINGFGKDSLLAKTRINKKCESSIGNLNVESCYVYFDENSKQQIGKINILNDKFKNIYVDDEVINILSEHGINVKPISSFTGNKKDIAIICLKDFGCNRFFEENSYILFNEQSLFKNKNCENNMICRKLAIQIIETKEINLNNYKGLHVVAEQIDYLKYI